jgi:peptidoglycan L-alanyl-D-glutamate endopeptidase CwlK
MPSRKIEDAHAILQSQYKIAKDAFEKANPNYDVILTATYRSGVEQNSLYEQGRTKPGPKVTNAKAGQSPHNFLKSFAIDVAFVDKTTKKLDWNVKLFKSFAVFMKHDKIEWGGGWKFVDYPHFEIKGWKALVGK